MLDAAKTEGHFFGFANNRFDKKAEENLVQMNHYAR